VVRIRYRDNSAEVGILPISPISHSLEQRRLDQRRDERARQPEERKNSECPRGWMNIGSVEITGAFRSASREAEDGENNNSDVVMSESILAVRGGCLLLLFSKHT
jgi:hypothetical protein